MGTDKSLVPIDDDAPKRGLQLIGDIKSGLDPLQILEKQEHEEIVQTIRESVSKLAVFHLYWFISLVKVERIAISKGPGPMNPFSEKAPRGLFPVLKVTLLPIWVSNFDAWGFAGGRQPSPWLVESGFSDVPRDTDYDPKNYLGNDYGWEIPFLSDLTHTFVRATQANKALDWLPREWGIYSLYTASALTNKLAQGLTSNPHLVTAFQECIETLPSGVGLRRTRDELSKRGLSYFCGPPLPQKEISSIDIENWRL